MKSIESQKTELESRKQELFEEIENYPTPITACDEQFNYLIEKRDKIHAQIQELESISESSTAN
jgi:sugar-specific transcriptional regulator TrmB